MLADVPACSEAILVAAGAFARPCASVTVALALLFAPSTSGAREVANSVTGVMPKEPSPAQSKAYRALRNDIDRADEAGDWDRFLANSGEALDRLPEHPSSEGTRREVVGLVGTHEIDQRTERQLERSIEILRAYQVQLRGAYQDEAESRPGWKEAERYIGDLLQRLPATASQLPAAAPHATPPPPPPSSPADTTNTPMRDRSVGPLAISGAVITGVGGVLLIAGLAFAPRAKTRLDDNNDAVRACEGASTCPEASTALDAWRQSLGTTLGLAIPGVVLVGVGVGLLVAGLRKKRPGSARATVACNSDGVLIHF